MINIKRLFFVSIITAFFFVSFSKIALADVHLTVRDGNTKIYDSSIALPSAGTVELTDDTGATHAINSQSVLSVVEEAAKADSSWNISKLKYYSSFGSLYLKCLTYSAGEKCDNWQYAVNNSYPSSGMDQNILSGNEDVYLFYGSQNQFTLSSSPITSSESFSVTAQNYDYQNNSWTPRAGVTVGVTTPNLSDPGNPTEVKTQTTNASGIATFSPLPYGTYGVGIKEDYYYPLKTLTVISDGGGSSASPSVVSGDISKPSPVSETTPKKPSFDTGKAISFLLTHQRSDGSFGNDIYTDWGAIALSSYPGYPKEKEKLYDYLSSHGISGASLTDYERRAMALMSLNINPRKANGLDYIEKITNSFDGTQFGNPALVNDDIFALITLENVGFSPTEAMMEKDARFVMSKQSKDGSWEENPDITGAAMLALAPFKQIPLLSDSIYQAKEFLKGKQAMDGGFGNSSSTAWAMEGILSLPEKPSDWGWKNTGATPSDYLRNSQQFDGGVRSESGTEMSRVWATEYALSAASGKTWNENMHSFPKENVVSPADQTAQVSSSDAKELVLLLRKLLGIQ